MRVRSIFAALVAFALVAGVWTLAIRALAAHPTVSNGTAPTAIVWSDRVFWKPQAMRSWIEGRGASYARWARLHPSAVSILVGRPVPRRRPPTTPAPATAKPTARRHQPSESAGATPTPSLVYKALFAMLLVVGGVLLALALVPRGFLTRSRWTAWVSVQSRPYALMAGISVLVGCLLAAQFQ
jgi:hypothetical protein